jgi:hypothetical protein
MSIFRSSKARILKFKTMSCCDGWSYPDSEVDGVCPDCGEPTVEGHAQSGCNYSPVICTTCGDAPCDGSC